MSTCEICGDTLKFMGKFRCQDGTICKTCYKKASRHYTETVTHKTIKEIQSLCTNIEELSFDDQFEITGKIGNYLLFDEKHNKICIANNRLTKQSVTAPEFYDVKDISKCKMACSPNYSKDQLYNLIENKSDKTLEKFKIVISFKNGTKKEIVLINNPVRVKSYGFRKTFSFGERIIEKLEEMLNNEKY